MAFTPTRQGNGKHPVADRIPHPSMEERLDRIEAEVREQGEKARSAWRMWGIFAVFALLIAGANLIAVATKLDSKSSSKSSAAPAAAAPAKAAATPAATGKVGVALSEFKITPNASQAPSGKVTFDVRNAGSIQHEFVVVKTKKPAGSLLKGAEADESGNVGEIGGVDPGKTKSLSLNLKPGHYALICNLPGHYKAGQHADFTVK